ncbi:Phytochrome-like protein cph2 [Paraurantiacibacter namhicola]|uniref:Phytochrome-like protein cph2 n=2 Tax=Paraurantiacibacter namhicola TaxID=645517 RepID=A0A1C7D9W1_9SPHN|nr:Phytochrome-like protein cph2 [Paraurantiacibacter namhicola]
MFQSLGGQLAPSGDVRDPLASGEIAIVTRENAQGRLAILDDFEDAKIGWLWASDAEGRLTYLSDSAAGSLGREQTDLLGQPLTVLFETDRDNPDTSGRPLQFLLKSRSKLKSTVVRFAVGKSASEVKQTWWTLNARAKFDDGGKFVGYRGSARDVTVEYEREIIDNRLADHDALTGLHNRVYMDRRIDGMLAAFKPAKRSCALLMLDLDRFKQVNDTLGHQAGDSLLQQVAERLRSVVGDRGEIGRLGGDEFQVLLPDLEDRGKLGELADKIIQIVSQPYPIDDKHAVIGTSVGVAVAPFDGVEREELVRSSDLALYAAKKGGRGQFRFYSTDLKDEEEERQLLVDDLREALATGQLELHYQPVVLAEDCTVKCLEALMRWEHPERGFVSPGVFIPVAEESDLINQLGEWALMQASEAALAWPSTVRVAVNVSAKQFTNPAFPGIVTKALAASGLEPDRLELELTESVFLGDSEVTDKTFATLKKLGVRLALDDFGTGYSSLSYLRAAPFDKLKVDKSFVDSCTETDQNSAKIIAAIVGLSNALGMETTVEGVEAFDQLEVVRSKGATLIQGWLYAKAMPQEQVLARIHDGRFKIEPEGPDRHRPERRSVYRRIGVIHEDHRYNAMLRDLSKTGARVEGLAGVPQGEPIVLDLGAGQLAVGVVTRAGDADFAVEFEQQLVSDGANGLCTRHRVSPYALAAAGMPLTSLPDGSYSVEQLGGNATPKSPPAFMEVVTSKAA